MASIIHNSYDDYNFEEFSPSLKFEIAKQPNWKQQTLQAPFQLRHSASQKHTSSNYCINNSQSKYSQTLTLQSNTTIKLLIDENGKASLFPIMAAMPEASHTHKEPQSIYNLNFHNQCSNSSPESTSSIYSYQSTGSLLNSEGTISDDDKDSEYNEVANDLSLDFDIGQYFSFGGEGSSFYDRS